MLFLKSFFRKKSTIIYLIIYSVILTTIIGIYSLIKYNQNVMNDIYKQKSFISLTCTGDYYEEILKSKNVEGVDRIILFKANDNNTVFKRQSYTIISKDTIVDYDNGEKADEVVTWGDYMWMIHNAIIISSDKDKDFKLQDDEIALSSEGVKYKKQETIDSLIGQNVSFTYNDEEVEFVIKGYYDLEDQEMTISENKFNELNSSSNRYSYKVHINNYLKNGAIIEELKNLINNENIEIGIALTSGGDESATRTTEAINLIGVLEPMGFVIICVFVIIFVVVSKNILSDEKKNSNIERLLGYNKKQVKRHTALKAVVLSVLALLIALIISGVVIIVLR